MFAAIRGYASGCKMVLGVHALRGGGGGGRGGLRCDGKRQAQKKVSERRA